jgi:hypothetical protein
VAGQGQRCQQVSGRPKTDKLDAGLRCIKPSARSLAARLPAEIAVPLSAVVTKRAKHRLRRPQAFRQVGLRSISAEICGARSSGSPNATAATWSPAILPLVESSANHEPLGVRRAPARRTRGRRVCRHADRLCPARAGIHRATARSSVREHTERRMCISIQRTERDDHQRARVPDRRLSRGHLGAPVSCWYRAGGRRRLGRLDSMAAELAHASSGARCPGTPAVATFRLADVRHPTP